MVRALIRVIVGLLVACLAAGLVQVLFVVTPADLARTESAALADRVGSAGLLTLLAATQTAVFAAPFALLAGIFGEWQRITNWVFYGLAGLAIGIAGFAAQYSAEGPAATIVNDYALRAFLTTGFIAGFVYWMVAGRHAGHSRPRIAVERLGS